MHRYKQLSRYVFRQWRWLVAILVLTMISASTAALQPWPMKLLVDYALGDAGAPPVLESLLTRVGLEATPTALVILAAAATLILFVIGSALSVALSVCWTLAGQRMVYDLAGDMFARLQRLSLLFHSRTSVGDSLSRLTSDTKIVASLADNVLITPIQESITLGAMICIGFALDPVLGILAMAVAPLLALSSRYFGKRLKQRARLGREANSRLMSFTHQTLGAIPLVQTFGTEPRHTEKFQDLADDAVVLAQRGNLLGSGYGLVNGLITTTGMALVLYVGGVRVLSGAISLGTLLVFLAYVRRMQDASGSLFKVFAKLKAAEASVDRILEVMESSEEVPESIEPVKLPKRQDGARGNICLENVTFGYEPGVPVINEVTLEVRPGEVVALVGPTGAGKSTLVSLIPRFFDPWEGRVTFDGMDIRQVKLADLRSQISIVLQDPFLMPMSVAENIAYGRPGATQDEIVEAAKAAQADDFIRRMPDGYDTVIAERGATLSGGERQRLSIARALLKDARVLILDEPTSALDAQTEASLLESFRRLMEGRTTFVIAHRLSTIRHADRIAVLEQGRLIELGSHEELLEAGGLYQHFCSQQFGKPHSKVVA